MNKKDVVHTDNGILLSHKKEWNTAIYSNWMDPGTIQWSQSERERHIPYDIVRGVCNFLGSISLQQKFEVMDGPVLQLHVTAQIYLESKEKYILKAWGHADPNDVKRRGPPTQFWLLFLYGFSPPVGPALCKLG